MVDLREYQQRVIDGVRQAARNGFKRILVVLPTGAGKTHVASSLVESAISKGNNALAIMHRRGLVDQMVARFEMDGIDTGCIMAGTDSSLGRSCQVVSLWTYVRRLQLCDLEINKFFVNTKFVLIDEAHHVLNKTYQKVLSNYPDAFVVGMTATPTLSTGAGLGGYFETMVNVVPMSELLDGGYLVPGEYYGPSDPDLSKLKIVQGDYEKKGLDEKFNKPKIIGDVVDNWFERAYDKQTMVFAINRKHAKAICHEFVSRGVKAEYLDAHNDDQERSDVIDRFKNRETQVICNVALYLEGTDIPSIGCLVIARPTRSLGLHRQILGRGARPYIEKDSFLVLDHGGNVKRLGLYEDEIAWSLNGKPQSNNPKKPRRKEKTIIDCPMCSHLFTGPVCPKCGHQIKNYAKKIAALDAQLVPIKKEKKRQYTIQEKQLWLNMFEYERRIRGYKNGFTAAKYKEKFGVWPRKLSEPTPVEPNTEFVNWMKYTRIKWAKSKQVSQR